MSDNRKEGEEKMTKAIFISGDGWLAVFDLLPASQLGLGIAMISHRFDFYVDVHFRTRKWSLDVLSFGRKIGENGTNEMGIVNYDGEALPIPPIELPRKVIGFERIIISFIDRNTIDFLRRFRQLFASCPIYLTIFMYNDRMLEFVLRTIWPMLGKNICGMRLSTTSFHCLRQFVPSILTDCPSLCFVYLYCGNIFTDFLANDNAMAPDGQALSKWLFTPNSNDVPKMFNCWLDMNLTSNVEAFKAAFANSSSSVNFIVVIWFRSPFASSVVPFALTNKLTHEQLTLKRTDNSSQCFLLVRCPIARDESKWAKWEEEAIGWQIYNQWNNIDIQIYDKNGIEDGLLDETLGQK